jgi:lipopolysaccharide transport system permease protein
MKISDKKYLNLLREIAISQFKLKDQSTFFGFLWSLLNPLIMLIIIYIVFNHRLGESVNHYAIYVLIGVIQYTYFANATGKSMQVLYSMKALTAETLFPKEILVLGSVFSSTLEFLLTMLLGVIIAITVGVKISWSVLLLPLVVILQILLIIWVSLILSCLFVFIRDIGHIYQVFLRGLFFITPIFYTKSLLGKGIAQTIVMLNPLTHLVEFSRTVILDGDLISIKDYLLLVVINLVFIFFTFKVFKQLEPDFAENV